jgi:GNAT superfamily N-acetyltransferase
MRRMTGSGSPAAFEVRPARREDLPAIFALIRELADFERLTHLCTATEADLDAALFGPRPAAEVLLAWKDDVPAAFALFYHNFSTFLGRRGLWLEDLFVQPAYRRQGCAKALLRALAGIARDRGCGRFEWTVLDWNASAISFYERLGATVLPDWRITRVTGRALAELAAQAPIGEA